LNFRSNGELIQFFNTTFSHIFDNKGAGALEEYESVYVPIKKANYSDNMEERGSAVFYLIPDQKGSVPRAEGYSKIEREASLLADVISRILGREGREAPEYQRYGSIREKIEKGEPAIGVLFFAYTHIKTFETILREAGIPFVVNKGKGFFRCEEIMEMVQLLAYLSDSRQRSSQPRCPLMKDFSTPPRNTSEEPECSSMPGGDWQATYPYQS
jgi:ATP-dependent exoDNAse (exonuclease V) beta subunit